MLCEKLLVKFDGILYLIVFYDFFELFLEVREKANSTWLVIDFFIIVFSL
jgi:hypothetical protein